MEKNTKSAKFKESKLQLMRNLIYKQITNGKNIFSLLVITNIIYLTMIIYTIPKVMVYSNGLQIIDLMPIGYNHEYVVLLLTTLGEKGRAAYLFTQIPLDLLYPLFHAISYCLLLSYIFKKLNKIEGGAFYLSVIPLFSGFCDYVENFGVIMMLNSFPNNPPLLTQVTSFFSILKSGATTIYFFILIYFSMELLLKKYLKNKT